MKLKTRKSLSKRVRFSGAKAGSRTGKSPKLVRKAAGQDHYNAAESGTVTRKKRRPVLVAKSDIKTIRRQLPYS
ncbi:MAG: hypothetical protein WC052_03350 [Patescibacteria group bacterium]